MPQKANGDYYYVESETVNDLLDDFAIYQDGTDFKLHDKANDEEAAYVAGAGFDVPLNRGYHVNGTQVVGEQQSGLTAQDAATVDGTYGTEEVGVIENNRTRIAELETALQNHGLIQ